MELDGNKMSALEWAQSEKDRKEKEKAEAVQKAEDHRQYVESRQAGILKGIEETLKEFDGVSGLVYRDKKLWKDETIVAVADVGWETWDNPNYDYKVPESDFGFRWSVVNLNKHNWSHYKDDFVRSFGVAMSEII